MSNTEKNEVLELADEQLALGIQMGHMEGVQLHALAVFDPTGEQPRSAAEAFEQLAAWCRAEAGRLHAEADRAEVK